MKTLQEKTIPILYLLLFILLFHSCEVYHFRGIYVQGDKFYGLRTKNGEYSLQDFSIHEIESIQLQNLKLSKAGNVLIGVGVVTLGVFLLYRHEMKDFDCCGVQFPM